MKKLFITAFILVTAVLSSCDLLQYSLSSQLNKVAYPADKYFALDRQIFEFDAPYDAFYSFNVQDGLLYLMLITDYSSYWGEGDFNLYTMDTNGSLQSLQFLTNMDQAADLVFSVTYDYTGTKQFCIKNGYLFYFNGDKLVQYNLSTYTVTRTLDNLDHCYIYNNADIYVISNQTKVRHFSANASMTVLHQWDIPASTLGNNTMSILADNVDVYITRNYTDISLSECKSYTITGIEQESSEEISLVYDLIQGDPAILRRGYFQTFNSRLELGISYGFASAKADGFELKPGNATFPVGQSVLYVAAEQPIGDKVRIYRYTIPE